MVRARPELDAAEIEFETTAEQFLVFLSPATAITMLLKVVAALQELNAPEDGEPQ